MKNILIPTDFSDTAKDAFLYAQSFVSEAANFIVFHAYHPQLEPDFTIVTTADTFYKDKEKAVKAFIASQPSPDEGNLSVKTYITSLVKSGLATDVIVEESKKNTDLVVMGRTGSNNLFDKIFGSVSTHTAQNAHCPVLIVPKGTKFKGIKRVLYAASNSVALEEATMKQMLSLVALYKPEIHFVQIQDDVFNSFQIGQEEQYISNFFKEKNASRMASGFKLVRLRSDNTMESLYQYATDNDIDLIVLTTVHRNAIGTLFHKSMTKSMVLNANIPLLVMHSKSE